MRVKWILIAIAVIAVSFAISLAAMNWLSSPAVIKPPVLTALPPLPPASRNSVFLIPIAIPLATLRDAADRAAPHKFAGKAANPVSQILQNADINWTAARGPIAASGAQDVLSLATPLTGNLTVTGSLSAGAKGAIGDALGKLLGGKVAQRIGSINIKQFNANAAINGSVAMTAQPTLAANWRVDPHLTAQVNLGDTNVSVAGVRVSVPAEVKPVIDKAVNDQLAGLQNRIRNDPALEQSARREWIKLCRSIPLRGASNEAQGLWLELRPVKAIAAQPRVDASALTLTLGVEAETRITSTETTPQCPFPATLTLVPAGPGQVSIGLPIDLPFTEIGKLIDRQLAGKSFPDNGSGPVAFTVRSTKVAAAGDRLLISLDVSGQEKKFFGYGGDATIHIWGKPVLDPAQQTVRLTDIALAVESEAAFGLLGPAARAAMPLLQKTLADRAVIDLRPLASNARRRIGSMLSNFQKNEEAVRIDAEIDALKLSGIAFDSTTLRVIAEAEGIIKVELRQIPGL